MKQKENINHTKTYDKLTDKHMIAFLLFLCWIAYFATYLGRLNYTAGLSEIIRTEGFSKGEAGMIGTGFLLFYGIGQLFGGFAGDKFMPEKMVFTGLFLSGICNLLVSMAVSPAIITAIWCANGLFQSLIWSPMIRIMFEYYDTETRMRSCVALNSSVPLGTMAAYGGTAFVIWQSGWRLMFLIASLILTATSILWFFGIRHVKKHARLSVTQGTDRKKGDNIETDPYESVEKNDSAGDRLESDVKGGTEKSRLSMKSIMYHSGFLFLIVALFIQGILKDGVTAWVPTYINETYGLSPVLSITGTTIIPIFNLAGVYLASWVLIHWMKTEIKTAALFFWLCTISLLVLCICSGQSMPMAFFMLAASTTAMMAVNTMLIAVLPSYFGAIGRASSVSGVLNSAVYAGGAVSSYGIGVLSSVIGWEKTIICWIVLSVIAAISCALTIKKWLTYKKNILDCV